MSQAFRDLTVDKSYPIPLRTLAVFLTVLPIKHVIYIDYFFNWRKPKDFLHENRHDDKMNLFFFLLVVSPQTGVIPFQELEETLMATKCLKHELYKLYRCCDWHAQLQLLKYLLFSQLQTVRKPHTYNFHSVCSLLLVWRNLSFHAGIIGVWYLLCIRENVAVVGTVRHDDTCRAGTFAALCHLPVNFTVVLKLWLWAGFEGKLANPVITPHLHSHSLGFQQVSATLEQRVYPAVCRGSYKPL